MIVIDTSVIIAILLEEPEKDAIAECMAAAERIFISAATMVELGIVAYGRLGDDGLEKVAGIVSGLEIEVHIVDAKQSSLAIEAYKRFGRGTGHPARLNFGDCFSYALAKALDLPLLFKGDDFVHTDIRSAPAAA